jgi:hypothetical protein
VEAITNHLANVDFGNAWHSAQGLPHARGARRCHYGYDLSTPQGRADTIEEHLVRLAKGDR